jgi:hypothetical protein
MRAIATMYQHCRREWFISAAYVLSADLPERAFYA